MGYIFFKADLDDYDQTQIPKILDDEHVLLEYESDVDELEYAYLDFLTFYEYLAKEITEIVRAHRKDSDLLDFLAEIKENLINEVKAETVQESIEHELVTSDNQGEDSKEKEQSNFVEESINETYRIVEPEDAKRLVSMFFYVIGGHLLESLIDFANKRGFGMEIVAILFEDSLDEYEQLHLPKRLDNKHVLIDLEGVGSEDDELAYLDFQTFYEYVAERVKEIAAKKPSKAQALLVLLDNLKTGLDV